MGSEVYANPANAGGSSVGFAVDPLRDALAKIANLEARIKELTERRPMHTMPECTAVLVFYAGDLEICYSEHGKLWCDWDGKTLLWEHAEWWIPLPETTPPLEGDLSK